MRARIFYEHTVWSVYTVHGTFQTARENPPQSEEVLGGSRGGVLGPPERFRGAHQ